MSRRSALALLAGALLLPLLGGCPSASTPGSGKATPTPPVEKDKKDPDKDKSDPNGPEKIKPPPHDPGR
jgi:hypothetical protein